MADLLGKVKNSIQGLFSRTDRNPETVTSTEAAQPGDAEDTVQETGAVEETGKLVVVGRESTFSKEIIDYAVDMAERMSYEIVALNTAPLSCETLSLSISRDQICADFQQVSEQSAQPFHDAAKKRGIPFTHMVKYSESREVLKALKKEIGGFEFVVSEEENDDSTAEADGDGRSRQEIFVYSML